MNTLQESILKVIAYFDIFNYPLTVQEIKLFMNQNCSDQKMQYALHELLHDETIFKSRDFYSLQNNPSLTIKRINGNNAATKQLRIAKQIAAFLTWFPFIKGIAISGSLSKNVAYKGSDIDFFIITTENRLWLSKLFFTLFIKFASVLGFQKWFCLNYVVDESSLEVHEKNIFTAIEIITLLPLYGTSVFNNFFKTNEWIYDYFPNHPFKTHATKEHLPLHRKLVEWILNNRQGDKADTAIMHYFDKRWKKMTAKNKFTKSGFQIGTMMVDKHFCRPYPEHFQQKILDNYEEKIQGLKANYKIAI
jgi:hypothetical protein